MGIDIHALNFLRYTSRKKALGQVATIGRQSLLVTPSQINKIIGNSAADDFGAFCEDLLLSHFGATAVDSYDYSDYEGATFIVDLNKPLAPSKNYDTVIDCGTVEHVYNVPQALANISSLCSRGGQIVHVSPGNNCCGHGFWQFSPELFFSLYSDANGYLETEVFVADLNKTRYWFEVQQPTNGARAEILTRKPLHVMCRTRMVSDFTHDNVQQSDYVYEWQRNGTPTADPRNENLEKLKRRLKTIPGLKAGVLAVRRSFREIVSPTRLSDRNRHLRRRRVVELLPN